ncbi:hypothetical protein Moror_10156 [Moniliophthora roreri MCA 2997]|uniref:Uncharacterized protein n=1 Tax=Moniliophthora roreri (strain MCA 2997) TaxID=1381753 RepID=V2WW10_MONRO|nr:hypothetical protein Moror_10156 [Moniliophthora roreri MCA 2997]
MKLILCSHKDTINAKRRHRIYKSTGNAQGSSCKGNSEPENATKCSFEEPTGIDIQAPNLMDTNQKDSKIGWNRSRKRKASTPPTAGRAKTPCITILNPIHLILMHPLLQRPTVNRERLQKMLEGDDDAWEESWQESAAITAQQQYMTAIKMGKSVTLEYFRAKDFVKTNTSDSATHPIAKSCMPDDDRPLWVLEVMAQWDTLQHLYQSVGASHRSEFLPELYRAHVQNFVADGYSGLLQDNQQKIAGIELCLQELLDKVWFRYGGTSDHTLHIQKLLDWTERTRTYLDEMIVIDITGTEELIQDYEQGLLPFQT